jgi:hypothetical protein
MYLYQSHLEGSVIWFVLCNFESRETNQKRHPTDTTSNQDEDYADDALDSCLPRASIRYYSDPMTYCF